MNTNTSQSDQSANFTDEPESINKDSEEIKVEPIYKDNGEIQIESNFSENTNQLDQKNNPENRDTDSECIRNHDSINNITIQTGNIEIDDKNNQNINHKNKNSDLENKYTEDSQIKSSTTKRSVKDKNSNEIVKKAFKKFGKKLSHTDSLKNRDDSNEDILDQSSNPTTEKLRKTLNYSNKQASTDDTIISSEKMYTKDKIDENLNSNKSYDGDDLLDETKSKNSKYFSKDSKKVFFNRHFSIDPQKDTKSKTNKFVQANDKSKKMSHPTDTFIGMDSTISEKKSNIIENESLSDKYSKPSKSSYITVKSSDSSNKAKNYLEENEIGNNTEKLIKSNSIPSAKKSYYTEEDNVMDRSINKNNVKNDKSDKKCSSPEKFKSTTNSVFNRSGLNYSSSLQDKKHNYINFNKGIPENISEDDFSISDFKNSENKQKLNIRSSEMKIDLTRSDFSISNINSSIFDSNQIRETSNLSLENINSSKKELPDGDSTGGKKITSTSSDYNSVHSDISKSKNTEYSSNSEKFYNRDEMSESSSCSSLSDDKYVKKIKNTQKIVFDIRGEHFRSKLSGNENKYSKIERRSRSDASAPTYINSLNNIKTSFESPPNVHASPKIYHNNQKARKHAKTIDHSVSNDDFGNLEQNSESSSNAHYEMPSGNSSIEKSSPCRRLVSYFPSKYRESKLFQEIDSIINSHHFVPIKRGVCCSTNQSCLRVPQKESLFLCLNCHICFHHCCLPELDNHCKYYQCQIGENYQKHHLCFSNYSSKKCNKCQEVINRSLCMYCAWCKKTFHYHNECFSDKLHDQECTLGRFSQLIIPSYLLNQNTDSPLDTYKYLKHPKAHPLMVVVNPKSGGAGKTMSMISQLRWLINPLQIINLKTQSLADSLAMFVSIPNLHIVILGGDGSACWVLAEMDKWQSKYDLSQIKLIILPCGTGNDLSIHLGWGSSIDNLSILSILNEIPKTHLIKVDRWDISISEVDRGVSLKVMQNYFSIGLDARIALSFHKNREACPEKYSSRLFNRFQYARLGGIQMIKNTKLNLATKINKFIVDDVDMTEMIVHEKPKAVLFLNISSYSGGTSPWKANNRSHKNFSPASSDDELLEIVFFSSLKILTLHVGVGGNSMAQASNVYMEINDPIAAQVDGEPFVLSPGSLSIEFKNKANFLGKLL